MEKRLIRIGALVGMGPNSTSTFYNCVMDYAREMLGAKFDIDFPEIVLVSLPTPFFPDRQINDEEMKSSLARGITLLDRTSVDFIVIPCNVVHKYYDFMQNLTNTKLLNIIDIACTGFEITVNDNVAVIATTLTIDTKLYQNKILANGLRVFHTEVLQTKVIALLMELKLSKLSEHAKILWLDIISYLEDNKCAIVIIACTDISVCIPLTQTKIQFVDSNDLLAKATIEEYIKHNNRLQIMEKNHG